MCDDGALVPCWPASCRPQFFKLACRLAGGRTPACAPLGEPFENGHCSCARRPCFYRMRNLRRVPVHGYGLRWRAGDQVRSFSPRLSPRRLVSILGVRGYQIGAPSANCRSGLGHACAARRLDAHDGGHGASCHCCRPTWLQAYHSCNYACTCSSHATTRDVSAHSAVLKVINWLDDALSVQAADPLHSLCWRVECVAA
jgi:hypothetical protein